ncbi:MAG: NAD-dependent epimerase/dehydratase family protein [Candidatus Micrarchaeota archaeon]
MKNNIYITGATGRLGRVVLPKINAMPLVLAPSGLKNEVVTDFSEEQLKKILKNAKIIVHIAGSVDTYDRKKLMEGNVELTKKIVSAAPKNSRIIFASSISVYGKSLAKKPADEETKTNPDSDYAQTKYDAEKLVASHPNHVILRIGTIYGPQFSDYKKILLKIKKGNMKKIGDGTNNIPFVHVDDVAEVFKNSLEKGYGIYVITGEAKTQNDIYAIAAKELGTVPPTEQISVKTAMFFASLGEIWYTISGKKPSLSKEHIAVLAYDRIFNCSKAKRELEFKPKKLENGIKEIARQL